MKRFLLAAAALAPIAQSIKNEPQREPTRRFYTGRRYGKSRLAQNMADYAKSAGLRYEQRNGSTIIFK